MKISKEEFEKKIKNITDEVIDVIVGSKKSEAVSVVVKKYSLTLTQKNTLSEQVDFVLMGLNTYDGFKNDLASDLEIVSDVAQSIAEEIYKSVFANLPFLKTESTASKTPQKNGATIKMNDVGLVLKEMREAVKIQGEIPEKINLKKALENIKITAQEIKK